MLHHEGLHGAFVHLLPAQPGKIMPSFTYLRPLKRRVIRPPTGFDLLGCWLSCSSFCPSPTSPWFMPPFLWNKLYGWTPLEKGSHSCMKYIHKPWEWGSIALFRIISWLTWFWLVWVMQTWLRSAPQTMGIVWLLILIIVSLIHCVLSSVSSNACGQPLTSQQMIFLQLEWWKGMVRRWHLSRPKTELSRRGRHTSKPRPR